MEKKDALEKYSLIVGDILHEYKDADQECIVNDEDPDLIPIAIPLPEPPDWEHIAGFGLHAKEQKFINYKPEMPKKLRQLQMKSNKDGDKLSPEEIWEIIENDPQEYENEIDWMKRMWYFRLYGFWGFVNGKPTYITGKHFFYMYFWPIDIGYPDYRSRDRKYWIYRQFVEEDTWDFAKKDDQGNAIAEDGWYEMVDLGRRVSYGFVYPKFRREGATFRAECDNYETISKLRRANGGIQSKNEDDAKLAFLDKLVKPSKKVPFFFRPMTVKLDPKKIMEFDVDSVGKSAFVETGLESSISFQDMSEGAYDGDKLYFFHDDEIGKAVKTNILKRHNITKKCLAQNAGFLIHGFTVKTSTSGEFVGGGGKNFQKMIEQSNFYNRNKNGQTASGLYTLFISSIDGLFVDEFGDSLIDDPGHEVLVSSEGNYFKTKLGARSHINNTREFLIQKGDIEGWHEEVRQVPIRISECFLSASNSIGFNIHILSSRIAELNASKPKWVTGNFKRYEPSNRFSKVYFEEDPNGNFNLSKILKQSEANKFFRGERGWYYPGNGGKYNAGADPFKFGEVEGNRMSDGGLAVKYKYDEEVDPLTKPIEDWESDRFVLTYRHRPDSKKEYTDDVLKACLYFGCPVLSETNVPQVVDDFTEWGAYPFLKHLRDKDGNIRKTPGFHSGVESKQTLFNGLRDYIERRGLYERHLDLIKECFEIPNIKAMSDYDLLTAAGLSELSEKSDYGVFEEESVDAATDISDWFNVNYD